MIILTAGNHRFKSMIKTSIKQAKKFGYKTVVYDLGRLGFGRPFKVENASFHERGYYWKIKDVDGSKATAFHKISVIKDYLSNYSDAMIYLDGDAVLIDKIDEIIGDYDIGLTVRPREEVEETDRMFKGTKKITDGYINAGVMFFNNTEATKRFIDMWTQGAEKLKDDQMALNNILQKYFPLKTNQTINLDGIKIRTFATRIYNYYYFNERNIKNVKILHFKNDRRNHYDARFRPFLFYSKKIWARIKRKIT